MSPCPAGAAVGVVAGGGSIRSIHSGIGSRVQADAAPDGKRSTWRCRRSPWSSAGQLGRRGTGASRQHAGIRRDAHLRAHQRLSEELVFRYRRAREGGAIAGGDRDPGNRPPTRPGARRPGHGAGQLRLARPPPPATESLQDGGRGQAGHGKQAGRPAGQEGHRRFSQVQCPATGGDAAVPEGLRAVRGCHHGAQHRLGALIDAGANSPGKELFDLAATDRLRCS